MDGPFGNVPQRTGPRRPGTPPRTGCAGRTVPSSAHLESESHHFGHADFGLVRQRGFGATGQPPAVKPCAIAALIDHRKCAGIRIALQAQVLARDLVAGVQREVDPETVAAPSDGDFVLRDEEGLRSGVVAVADLCKETVGLSPGGLAVAHHSRGSYGWLPFDQGG